MFKFQNICDNIIALRTLIYATLITHTFINVLWPRTFLQTRTYTQTVVDRQGLWIQEF